MRWVACCAAFPSNAAAPHVGLQAASDQLAETVKQLEQRAYAKAEMASSVRSLSDRTSSPALGSAER